MSGQAVPYELHAGQQVYLWCGGSPSAKDFEDAPFFTIFPGAKAVAGDMPMEHPSVVEWDDTDYPFVYIGSRDDCPYCGDKKVEAVVEAFPTTDAVLMYFPDFPGELEDEVYDLGGGRKEKPSHDAANLWAHEAGFSLWKIPDRLAFEDEITEAPVGPMYMLFVMDPSKDYRKGGYTHVRLRQTPLYAEFRALCGPVSASVSQVDIDVINRHRRGLGMGDLDTSAGWTTRELKEMAESIRKTGRMNNPRHQKLKRSLMR